MAPWIPGFVVALIGLAASGVGWLLTDRAAKTRTEAALEATKAKADATSKTVDEHREALIRRDEDCKALRESLDRLDRSKADATVVVGVQAALVEFKAEMIRLFERLETRLDNRDAHTPRRRSR